MIKNINSGTGILGHMLDKGVHVFVNSLREMMVPGLIAILATFVIMRVFGSVLRVVRLVKVICQLVRNL